MNNFQNVYNRKNTHSFKWDNVQAIFQTDDILPMWVADMDFKAPQEVNDALRARAEHGIYGYTTINDSIQNKVRDWVTKRHDWDIKTDWLSFSPGVITSLYISVTQFTEPNDKVLIQTPVYTPFFNIIKDSGRELVENPLLFNGDSYEIDFVDFEEKLKQGVKAFIFCSPHNPVGRVWEREELEEIARLCLQYDVLIFSDEIHADLVFKEYKHIPIASLSDRVGNQTITYMSPTKTFNLAGLQASYVVTADKEKKTIIDKTLAQQGFSMLNTMGVIALEAAYTYGEPWLEGLLDVISENKQYAINRLELETDGLLKVLDAEGTYLLWIDCSKLGMSDAELKKFLIEEAKVGLNAGSNYGKNGEQFMRINIACPQQTLEEGINRIVTAIKREQA